MPPRKQNPIASKLMQLIHSGKTIAVPATRVKITKELICFLCDLKYPTLQNVFCRSEISYATLKSLKFAGLVTDKEEMEYRKWCMDNTPKRKMKKRGIFDDSNQEAGDSSDQSQEFAKRFEAGDEPEISDPAESRESDGVFSEE